MVFWREGQVWQPRPYRPRRHRIQQQHIQEPISNDCGLDHPQPIEGSDESLPQVLVLDLVVMDLGSNCTVNPTNSLDNSNEPLPISISSNESLHNDDHADQAATDPLPEVYQTDHAGDDDTVTQAATDPDNELATQVIVTLGESQDENEDVPTRRRSPRLVAREKAAARRARKATRQVALPTRRSRRLAKLEPEFSGF